MTATKNTRIHGDDFGPFVRCIRMPATVRNTVPPDRKIARQPVTLAPLPGKTTSPAQWEK